MSATIAKTSTATVTRHPLLSVKPMKQIQQEVPEIVDASMAASAIALLLGNLRGAAYPGIDTGADVIRELRDSGASALIKELAQVVDTLVA